MKIKSIVVLMLCLCLAIFAFGCADNSTDGGEVSDSQNVESVSDTDADTNDNTNDSTNDTDGDNNEEDNENNGIEGSGNVDDRPVADLGELPPVSLN